MDKDEIRKLLEDNNNSIFDALAAYEPPKDCKKEFTYERFLEIKEEFKGHSAEKFLESLGIEII